MSSTPSKSAARGRAVDRFKRVEVIVNPKSGGVSPNAPAELEAALEAHGVDARMHICGETPLDAILDEVFDAKPDLVIVLAGDGTVRAVASRARPEGPVIAPLPGGTMNMLPKAVYGVVDWKVALDLAVTEGEVRPIAGGTVNGEAFYCAAILGAPAMWATAREAMREGKAGLAFKRARLALRRAFTGRIRFRLERGKLGKTEALVLITPLISTALTKNDGLEAAVMGVQGASEAFRLAAHAVFSDWRNDPAVETKVVKRAQAWARSRIPAILDGETVRLGDTAEVRFQSVAFQVLAPEVKAAG